MHWCTVWSFGLSEHDFSGRRPKVAWAIGSKYKSSRLREVEEKNSCLQFSTTAAASYRNTFWGSMR